MTHAFKAGDRVRRIKSSDVTVESEAPERWLKGYEFTVGSVMTDYVVEQGGSRIHHNESIELVPANARMFPVTAPTTFEVGQRVRRTANAAPDAFLHVERGKKGFEFTIQAIGANTVKDEYGTHHRIERIEHVPTIKHEAWKHAGTLDMREMKPSPPATGSFVNGKVSQYPSKLVGCIVTNIPHEHMTSDDLRETAFLFNQQAEAMDRAQNGEPVHIQTFGRFDRVTKRDLIRDGVLTEYHAFVTLTPEQAKAIALDMYEVAALDNEDAMHASRARNAARASIKEQLAKLDKPLKPRVDLEAIKKALFLPLATRRTWNKLHDHEIWISNDGWDCQEQGTGRWQFSKDGEHVHHALTEKSGEAIARFDYDKPLQPRSRWKKLGENYGKRDDGWFAHGYKDHSWRFSRSDDEVFHGRKLETFEEATKFADEYISRLMPLDVTHKETAPTSTPRVWFDNATIDQQPGTSFLSNDGWKLTKNEGHKWTLIGETGYMIQGIYVRTATGPQSVTEYADKTIDELGRKG